MTLPLNRTRTLLPPALVFAVVALTLVACSLVAGSLVAGCSRPSSGNAGDAAASERAAEERSPGAGQPAHASEPAPAAEPEEGESEPSDLDLPVETLLAMRCEHGMATYTCPECRYETGVAEAGRELFGSEALMDTIAVGRKPLGRVLTLNGEVVLAAGRSVVISPRATGMVRKVRVDVGSPVRRGDVLLELDCADYSEAKAEYLRARAASTLAAASWNRESEMVQQEIGPRKSLEEAQAQRDAARAAERAARERLSGFGVTPAELERIEKGSTDEYSEGLLPVRAPFNGTVLEQDLHLGALVQPGDELLLLGDTSEMWVVTSVYERELALLIEEGRNGQLSAEVTVSAWPGRVFPGRIDRLHGTLDEHTRTARVRVLLDNTEGLLRAGMFARVRVFPASAEAVLAVPEEAVLDDEGRSFVFVRLRPPYFIRRPVWTGATADGWTTITRGLTGHEVIVSRGAFLLKSDVLRSKMGAGCAD